MRNTFSFRRVPAGLAATLATIGLLAGAGAVGAQSSATEYAIVHNGYGSVVARRTATGSAVTTSAGVIFDTATGKTTPLPAGSKLTLLYVVSNGATIPLKDVVAVKVSKYLECKAGTLPTVKLGPTSTIGVTARMQTWRCMHGGV